MATEISIGDYEEMIRDPNYSALVAEYMEESGNRDLGAPNPNHKLYRAMINSGVLIPLVVRDDGVMIGYASLLISIVPHYSRLVGTVESIFITKAKRITGAGMMLIRRILKEANDREASGVFFNCPVDSDLHRVMQASRHARECTRSYFWGLDHAR